MHPQNPLLMYPINVGAKCRLRLEQSQAHQQCLQETIHAWFSTSHFFSTTSGANHHHHSSGSFSINHDGHNGHHSNYDNYDNYNYNFYDVETKSLCCYRWGLLDCLTASIRQICHMNGNQFKAYLNKRNMLIEHYETEDCRDYRYDAWFTCHLSWWIFTVLLLLSILLCLGLGLIVAWNWRWIGPKVRPNPINIHNRSTNSRALTDL